MPSGLPTTKAVRDRAAADARDELVFTERRAQEAANFAKTQRLRALRLGRQAEIGPSEDVSK
jgi:hypothetical protein